MNLSHAALVLLAAAQASAAPVPAEPALAASELRGPQHEEQQMADYLGLLRSIAPAAEDAARTYVAAMLLKCRARLDAAGLRGAMARERGDAVLMGLIRAVATQDAAERHRLVAQMRCPTKALP